MKAKLIRLHSMFARHVADLSHCKRAKVGCVLTSLDGERVLAFGYNGTWRGGPNTCVGPDEPGKCECVHAEANALAKSRPMEEFAAHVTTSPCVVLCAKLLVNSGCREVYAASEYRDASGIDLLLTHGMKVFLGGEEAKRK